ncbi:nucleoside deaminase [Wenzhouxiangella sp. XN79A]|uniref:nucleoside deaminase n=1 Tax=Wenzhouxiangella sp. XN79A TaxID=2724193 RepID=UPI00144A70B7|nr:nucleoside deaminase [Wenzhouxiangella sp. XN79A]NKI34046.1 nucleoside deaminase [Wenzhouxiangella sp. XN79A]
MSLPTTFAIALPDWFDDWLADQPERFPAPEDRMRAAVELSRLNVERGTGGPFGALVTDERGRLVAAGVNRVEPDSCSSAHGEIVALSLAQARLGTYDLSQHGALELATSCEPCAMCLGAIPWSGIKRVLCGASKTDAEVTGFDEGERIEDWTGMLKRRGIEVVTGLLQDEAAAVLRDYARRGSRIYNAG